MLRVLSDVLGSDEAPKVTLLSLLNLSAAFSTIHCSYCDCSVTSGLQAKSCDLFISPRQANETSSVVDRLTRCLNDVNAWLSASRLRLNPAKTQILWLGSKHLVSDIAVTQVPVLASSVTVADSARDLGVVIDSCLTMADHVSAICRSGYFQLRQLRPVARSLTANAAKTIVHAFVACRLDYCNSLLHGFTD